MGCMTPNVSSRCASYEGGSEGTAKISSPPYRGLSWAAAGIVPAISAAVTSRRDRLSIGALLYPGDRVATQYTPRGVRRNRRGGREVASFYASRHAAQ